MTDNRKFRFENKYLLDVLQKETIKAYIEGICNYDKYVSETEGSYYIRSLYFDTYNSMAYQDNEAGVDIREKYRIRIYNCNSDYLVLERKIKVNGKISKDRTPITMSFFNAVLHGRTDELNFDSSNSLINRFLLEYHTNYLRPRIIVDYERTAFVTENIDVRMTFDKSISFSSDVFQFFNPNLSLQPILPVGQELLEVKYTEFLPEYVHQMLDLKNVQQSTFSKYYLCEKMRRQGEIGYDVSRHF